MIFYSKIFSTPQLQDLPPEWHTTYIIPFEISGTFIVFPEVYIHTIVKNILYQSGVTDILLIQFNFIALNKHSRFITSSLPISLGAYNISFSKKCFVFDHTKVLSFVCSFGQDKLFICKKFT